MKEHNCINEVTKRLMDANPRLTGVRILLSTLHDMDDKTAEVITGQPIEISFIHKKKNGDEIRKYEKTFVSHAYCPFCGKKYRA